MLQCHWCVYPLFVIFKVVRFRDIYKQDLPAGSEFAMICSGYMNEDFFFRIVSTLLEASFSGKMSTDLGCPCFSFLPEMFGLLPRQWH
jgi:hypothetical protein